jgi:hypothetical protein
VEIRLSLDLKCRAVGRKAQEELVEQSVLLYGDEEGQVFVVIFGLNAVRHVVLLEVEQAA